MKTFAVVLLIFISLIFPSLAKDHIAKKQVLHESVKNMLQVPDDPELITLANVIRERISLDQKDHIWLDSFPRLLIRVGDYPPFHFVNKGIPQGLSIDYVNMLCAVYNLNCIFVSGLNVNQSIVSMQQHGGIAVQPGWHRNEEREKVAIFTRPYVESPFVIFQLDRSDPIGSIVDLSSKKVVVERSYAIARLLEEQYSDLDLVYTNFTGEALTELAKGNADAYIGNLMVGIYTANILGLANIKVTAPAPFPPNKLEIALRKDIPELANLFDKALAAMTAAEHFKLRKRWLSTEVKGIISTEIVWQIVATAVLILLVILYWNRTLRKEILARKEAQAKLAIIDRFRDQFISQPDPFLMYNTLRDDLLDFTKSQYGLIGEISKKIDGNRYLIAYSLSNMAWNEATRELYEDYRHKGFVFDKQDSLFGRVITHEETVISNDIASDPRRGGWPEGHPSIKSFLGIPVLFGNKLVGEIGLANRRGGYDQKLVDSLAPVVAVLGQIIVARSDREARKAAEAELRRLATTDPLTEIANRRRFDTQVKSEVSRAFRYNEDLTLLMLDIDYFKQINDTYGHESGDDILKKVAKKISSDIREADLLSRWGGEEFMILLPQTNAATGKQMAERVRRNIENHNFRLTNISISIGVTTLTQQDNISTLIERVDKALYKAKENGRNCVFVI